MKYNIIKVTSDNYNLFDDMIFWRVNGIERTQKQKSESSKQISNEVLQELKNSNLYIYAAIVDDKMAGWISLIYMPKVGKFNGRGHVYVDELWVEPSFQHKGLAKELMKKADELVDITNAAGIRLYVSQDNETAQNLYKYCGYKHTCTAYFMEKTCSPTANI